MLLRRRLGILILIAASGFVLPGSLGAQARAALLAPVKLRQGDPLLVWALSEGSLEGAEAILQPAPPGGKRVAAALAFAGPAIDPASPGSAAPAGGAPAEAAASIAGFRAWGFLMAVPMELPPGRYRILVQGVGAGSAPAPLSADLAVEARAFPSEDIALDAANTKLKAEPDPRKEAEAKKLAELLGRSDADAVYLDGSAFMMPIILRRKSAGCGDRRRYLYQGGGSEASVHAGLDLAAAAGTEVDACAPGRVVMAEERAVTGNTLVVEHLPGLYSLYMHLATSFVTVGQVVARGDRIGLAGSTGLSTGPHLHWELRAKGWAVDPEYWLSRPPLDKDRAVAIIAALIEGR
jgi:murein DD-endopeptidase MepM/ murein hydrolase activator NlpD